MINGLTETTRIGRSSESTLIKFAQIATLHSPPTWETVMQQVEHLLILKSQPVAFSEVIHGKRTCFK